MISSRLYERLGRPLLFALPAETAHALVLLGLRLAAPLLRTTVRADPVRVAGIDFPNRIGLAAGMDKDATALFGWEAIGFGHVEVGTVTPLPQPGNARPRVFRATGQGALVNRMGFPSAGADRVARRIESFRAARGGRGLVVGVNVGKNRETPIERASDDYVAAARAMASCAEYLTLNVSSPNTPGLRSLAAPAPVATLVRGVTSAAAGRPVLVKFDPDLPERAFVAAVRASVRAGASGVVVANTTLSRPERGGVFDEAGGLSGRPLHERAVARVRAARSAVGSRAAVVGVGGIFGVEDAMRMFDAGADLIQVYTGLVYRGPGLVRELAQAGGRRR